MGLCFDMKKSKPWKSIDEQINILVERGLSDAVEYKSFLSSVNYYRLAGYLYYFRNFDLKDETRTRRLETFFDDIKFKNIYDLYLFDFELRKSLYGAVNRIEILLRTKISYFAGEFDPLYYLNYNLCNQSLVSKKIYINFLNDIKRKIKHSKSDLIKFDREKYESLPVWAVIEIFDWSQFITLLRLLPLNVADKISQSICKVKPKIFAQWLEPLRFIRNNIAHFSRTWNCNNPYQLKIPKSLNELSSIKDTTSIYAIISLIMFLLKSNDFIDEMKSIKDVIKSFPNIPKLSIKNMGFPEDYLEQEIWK